VSSWGKRAEADNQYLQKGSKVLVEGRMRPDPETGGPRIWTDQDGNPRASYELTAFEVKFLSGRGDSDSFSDDAPDMGGDAGPDITEEEIPF
jgi:single-strand DNA-binding protein